MMWQNVKPTKSKCIGDCKSCNVFHESSIALQQLSKLPSRSIDEPRDSIQ